MAKICDMLLDPSRSALVLVDFQSRLMPVIHDAERVTGNAVFLARVARELGVPVLGTELISLAPRAQQVVLAGCETHVCLLQTALEIQQAGIQAFVVAEACGSRRPEDKQAALERLQQAGVTLVAAEMVAFEWLRSCEHPAFRPVLSLIKARP